MFASLSARLALITLLVFSQALFAGHSIKHDAGSQPECQICLQTSAGGAALHGGASYAPAAAVSATICPHRYTAPAVKPYFPLSHPSRAPPPFEY